MSLSKNQMKYLRRASHEEKALFQMGKNGLSESFIDQVDQALEKRELIKFNLLQNTDESLESVVEQIANDLGAIVVQTIGSTAILYRPASQAKHQDLSLRLKHI